jgi:soluble lytic murein transglycosylase-like protein
MKKYVPVDFAIGFTLLCFLMGVLFGHFITRPYTPEAKDNGTLNWLAHEYKKVTDSLDRVTKENERLVNYSFQRVMSAIVSGCIRHKVPVSVALLLVQIESGFDPYATSETNDYGLFQINYPIWKDELQIDFKRIFEPEYNIELGLTILKRAHKTGGNWPLAVGIYNMGKKHALSGHPEKLSKSIFN